MIIWEWVTTRFEVVVEHHETAAPPKVECLPGEIVIDLGKFSCAATLFSRRMAPNRVTQLSLQAATFAVSMAFLLGLMIDPAEAVEWSREYWSRHP